MSQGMISKAMSVIILCLNYQVLREVVKDITLMTMYVGKGEGLMLCEPIYAQYVGGLMPWLEFHAALRTKELIELRDLKVDDSGEGLSVSRGRCGSRGNHGNSKGCNKSKYKCFKFHKTNLFKKDRIGYRAMRILCNFPLPREL
ncbi:hypothetical protein MTR_3g052160 [Medicago truncatula]|uniref:Uncharacterized protein n=1 Tax=Medicago truncatula TaxID=3880 RepID=G7IY16_MEDTR|nr:hypothetical protein MTR_3g052160 [Medicago truncatula]